MRIFLLIFGVVSNIAFQAEAGAYDILTKGLRTIKRPRYNNRF
jgi:hypothetical protein